MKRIIAAAAIAGLFGLTACNRTALQERQAAIEQQQKTIDALNLELAKRNVIDSINELSRSTFAIGPQAGSPVTAYAVPAVRYVTVKRIGSSRSYPAYRQPVVYQQAPARRRGWSAKAKGAVIGGGTGAIAGAIINKRNRPVGALIGGLLGAGAGTGIGAIIDGRNGR